MNLNDKLNNFLNNKSQHAFLVHGPWGVGKTFAVDLWLKEIKDYKIIKLSLFGISDINDLNSLALKSEGLKNKFKQWLKGVNQDINVSVGPITIGMPLIGIVSSLLNEKHDDKNKYLFILDDIERKDNDLSIEKILGFVDSLPLDNTKIILVANLEKLDDLNEFKGFKEKVIQDEYMFTHSFSEAITEIIGNRYSQLFINNKYPIKNLRTLIKIKNILSFFDDRVDENMVNCIYLCLLNINENRFGKLELEKNYKRHDLELLKFVGTLHNNDSELENLDKKVESYMNKLHKETDYIYENIKLLNLLDRIKENELKKFVLNVYNNLIEENYEELKKVYIPKRNLPLKKYEEYGHKVFYSKNPDEEYSTIMNNFKLFFASEEYDLLDLFRKFYTTILNCKNLVSTKSKGKKIEKQVVIECPKLISSYIFSNSYFDENDVNSPAFMMSNIPDWIIRVEEEILINYSNFFNNYYLDKAKNERIDWMEINQRLYLIERIFYSSKIFKNSLFKLDEVMVNSVKYMSRILKENLTEETWSYCHSLIKWISQNRNKFSFDKTLKLLNEKASKKTLSGYRFSVLVKQYDLQ